MFQIFVVQNELSVKSISCWKSMDRSSTFAVVFNYSVQFHKISWRKKNNKIEWAMRSKWKQLNISLFHNLLTQQTRKEIQNGTKKLSLRLKTLSFHWSHDGHYYSVCFYMTFFALIFLAYFHFLLCWNNYTIRNQYTTQRKLSKESFPHDFLFSSSVQPDILVVIDLRKAFNTKLNENSVCPDIENFCKQIQTARTTNKILFRKYKM